MSIDALPRLNFVGGPTPLHPLPRLSATLGGPTIWAKRDDLTALAGGGNKARKLEFLLAEAQDKGADTVFTYGAVQSNHARMTAAAATMSGMEAVLFLSGTPPTGLPGNLLLDELLGARIVFLPDPDSHKANEEDRRIVRETRAAMEQEGRSLYRIPLGGSNPLGSCGYVAGFDELLHQLRAHNVAPSAITCAVGSCGTYCGIAAGVLLQKVQVEMRGYAVVPPQSIKQNPLSVDELIMETGRLVGTELDLSIGTRSITYDHVGEGYGIATDSCLEAIRLAAHTEGLILDPVYSGKAMAGLIADIQSGRFRSGEHVVFLHTGGMPGLFAQSELFVGD